MVDLLNSKQTRYVSSLLRRILALLVVLGFFTGNLLADDVPPNIVLIVSDDQGYNDLGVLNEKLITPNLDRICHEGVRLTNFYVAWPACTPSRAAFLTGRYPQRNGMYDMIRNEAPDYGRKYSAAECAVSFERIGGMDLREVLLPQLLRKAGYRSGIFGKWDLGISKRFLPLQRGFDDFYGFVNTGIDYFTHERYGVPSMFAGNKLTTADKGTYCTELFRREAMEFVKDNHTEPFFLYLPFNAPHNASNLDPTIRTAAQATQQYKDTYPELEDTLRNGVKYGKPAKVATDSKRQLEYSASITQMDDAIGDVLDFLDEHKLSDNTIVIFFSDNGGGATSSNVPLRGRKALVFEGGIRVCSAVRYPKKIPAGSVCDEFLTSLEVVPTLLSLAKVKAPPNIILDGFDMLPVLQGKPSPRKEMFWQRRDLSAVRLGNWKYVRNSKGEMLFDLKSDIGEKTDLAKSQPAQLEIMRKAFADWKTKMEAAEPRGPFRDY